MPHNSHLMLLVAWHSNILNNFIIRFNFTVTISVTVNVTVTVLSRHVWVTETLYILYLNSHKTVTFNNFKKSFCNFVRHVKLLFEVLLKVVVQLVFMPKIDFRAIWNPEKSSNCFFFETTFLHNSGMGIKKITIIKSRCGNLNWLEPYKNSK